MFPYIPISKSDEGKMLETIGIKNVSELFEDIPASVRFEGDLDLPIHKSEIEIRQIMSKYARKNKSASDYTCYLGDGTYDSYIPSIVPYLTSRSEFSTAYTPYQPEISQGTLHAIFEFQTLVTRLTDMYASNASMYDGPTAAAEAALMAFDKSKGDTLLISSTVNKNIQEVVKTYLKYRDFKVEVIDEKDFTTDLDDYKAKLNNDVVGVLVQSPNRYGYLEKYQPIFDEADQAKATKLMYVCPTSLGILKTPGEYGVDIAMGEMQTFGNAMHYGGPHIGFLATTKKLMRKLPGRIAGQGVDRHGNRAFVLTLQAREQHIRRDKASSNICSNQALNALSSTIYMSLLGKKGLKDVAINSTSKAHYLFDQLIHTNKFEKVTDQKFFREFVLKSKLPLDHLSKHLKDKGVMPFKVVSEKDQWVQIAVTENRTKEELDYLVRSVEVLR